MTIQSLIQTPSIVEVKHFKVQPKAFQIKNPEEALKSRQEDSD